MSSFFPRILKSSYLHVKFSHFLDLLGSILPSFQHSIFIFLRPHPSLDPNNPLLTQVDPSLDSLHSCLNPCHSLLKNSDSFFNSFHPLSKLSKYLPKFLPQLLEFLHYLLLELELLFFLIHLGTIGLVQILSDLNLDGLNLLLGFGIKGILLILGWLWNSPTLGMILSLTSSYH